MLTDQIPNDALKCYLIKKYFREVTDIFPVFIGIGNNESVIFPGKSMKPELLKVSKATRRVQRTRQVRGKFTRAYL